MPLAITFKADDITNIIC